MKTKLFKKLLLYYLSICSILLLQILLTYNKQIICKIFKYNFEYLEILLFSFLFYYWYRLLNFVCSNFKINKYTDEIKKNKKFKDKDNKEWKILDCSNIHNVYCLNTHQSAFFCFDKNCKSNHYNFLKKSIFNNYFY